MAQLSLECPHCRAEKIGFAYRGCAAIYPGATQTLAFMQCEGCGQGVIVTIDSTQGPVQYWAQGAAHSPGTISRVYPVPLANKAPADVPPEVSAAFLSGLDNLGRKGGANAAAIMFRRAIEIAVKKIDPDAPKGADLKTRISRLSDDVATPAMKKWANHVRLDANDATHEPEEFSPEDAARLRVFAEMFLTYAFTLPAMLKRAAPEEGA